MKPAKKSGVISLCNSVLKVFDSPIFSDWYDWMYWLCVGLFFLLLSLCAVFSATFIVWVLACTG